MFVGPPEVDSEWDDSGIDGVFRYLNKVWKLVYNYKDKPVSATKESEYLRNQLIKDITTRLNALTMNTVVSGFMEHTGSLIELAKQQDGIDPACIDTLLVLLAPFTPHIAEELWREMGYEDTVFAAGWPEWDESKLVKDEVVLPLQINGKARGNITISKAATKEEVLAMAKETLASRLEDKTIVKEIYVPGKIVNFVVK